MYFLYSEKAIIIYDENAMEIKTVAEVLFVIKFYLNLSKL